MELTEWIISIALILVVIRQIRGRRLTLLGLLWPVPLVAWGAIEYAGGVPAHAADWTFVAACSATGLALGVGCGLLTEISLQDGSVIARARWLAAGLWIVGMSGRLAFGLFATNGGAEKVGELSAKLGIHSASTWASALIAMALVEVVARSAVLFVRARRLRRAVTASALQSQATP
ncbi:MAG TPA: DUF1453 domain-containing protein [Protaetiibacter sp.]|jgi:hypothetical protein|nr:DUF1453 domain-containing protein [Protaetiibacter sp.]